MARSRFNDPVEAVDAAEHARDKGKVTMMDEEFERFFDECRADIDAVESAATKMYLLGNDNAAAQAFWDDARKIVAKKHLGRMERLKELMELAKHHIQLIGSRSEISGTSGTA
jgi:hypothetical protein